MSQSKDLVREFAKIKVSSGIDIYGGTLTNLGSNVSRELALTGTVVVATTGGTLTVGNTVSTLLLTPATTLANLTITLPTTGITEGKVIFINSLQDITNVTFGNSLAPIGSNVPNKFIYYDDDWYPF